MRKVRSANQYGAKRSPEMEDKFLGGLREGLTPKEAAERIGISRTTVFQWKRDDETFYARWVEAIDEGTDLLEAEARRRAVEGIDEPVFYQGVECAVVRKYSDGLLTLMLKGRRSDVYNTERHEHTGDGGGPIATETKVTVEFVDAADGRRKK